MRAHIGNSTNSIDTVHVLYQNWTQAENQTQSAVRLRGISSVSLHHII